jgi:hypothetical protein
MSSSSRSSALIVAAGVTVMAVAVIAFVTVSFGKARAQLSPAHRADGQYQHIRVTASAAAMKQGVKFAYVYGTTTVPPGQFFGAALRCPSKFPHPVSGGFDSDSNKVFASTNRPDPEFSTVRKARDWEVGVTNLDSSPASVMAVVVCER